MCWGWCRDSFVTLGSWVLAFREETLTFPLLLCSWDRKNNPEPWNRLSPNDQYKVPPPSVHLGPRTTLPTPRPRRDVWGTQCPFPSYSFLQFPLTIRS